MLRICIKTAWKKKNLKNFQKENKETSKCSDFNTAINVELFISSDRRNQPSLYMNKAGILLVDMLPFGLEVGNKQMQ